MKARKTKDATVKARVPQELKDKIDAIADLRGESEALVIREAIAEYLVRHPVGSSSEPSKSETLHPHNPGAQRKSATG